MSPTKVDIPICCSIDVRMSINVEVEAINISKYCQIMAHTLWDPTRRSTFRNYYLMNVHIQPALLCRDFPLSCEHVEMLANKSALVLLYKSAHIVYPKQ